MPIYLNTRNKSKLRNEPRAEGFVKGFISREDDQQCVFSACQRYANRMYFQGREGG